MVNNKLRLRVFVRVIDDPTGVLWHNFRNYDSRKVTGFVGVDNQGATCYMNSLLQSLYFTNQFRRAVYKVPTENDKPTQSVTLALQQLFHDLQLCPDAVNTIELTKSFGWDTQESFRQHDVQEFNRVLQDHLETKMKGTSVDGAIGKLFLGKMKSYIRCLNVDFESSRIEDYYDISLNVKGCKTLRDSFVNYCQVETLKGENKYMAEGYGLQDAKKGMDFMSFPPVLHLQLKRFEYDFMYDRMIKINDRFEFPFEIDLQEFLSDDAERPDPCIYSLYGVLVHSGDVSGGHYFAYLRPTEENKWYRFDDDRVIPVLEEEIVDESYGGDLNGSNNARSRPAGGSGYGPATRSVHKKITNAYMLVYIRKTRTKEILAPVEDAEIPKHIIKRSQEAKVEEELRRKEVEEKQRTVNITVVDDTNFSKHRGFDMCHFDDRQPEDNKLFSRRFPKDMRYSEFKDVYAKEMGLNKDKIRFWVMVGRVNKTVRLDSAIAEQVNSNGQELADQTIEKICQDNFKKWPGLRLYCEHMDRWVPRERFPKCDSSTDLSLILAKFYDPNTQTVEGLGKLYIYAKQSIKEIIPILQTKMKLPTTADIDIYEEIKPHLIEKMDVEQTFQQAEIQNGDIVCFQLRPNQDGSEESKVETDATLLKTIPEYFERLTKQLTVTFKQRPAEADEVSSDRDDVQDPDAMETDPTSPKDEFTLTLCTDDTYDTVAGAVARRLKISDPLRILFSRSGFGNNGFQPIRRTPRTTLEDMANFVHVYNRRQAYLYYEELSMSIVDMENTTVVPITYVGESLRDEHVVKVRVPNSQTAQHMIDSIYLKVSGLRRKLKGNSGAALISSPDMVVEDPVTSPLTSKPPTPDFTLRVYHQDGHRTMSYIDPSEPALTYIQLGYIVAEALPSVSDHPLAKCDKSEPPMQYGESRTIPVFHFANYLRNTHGVPFQFTIFKDEPWNETWERIHAKLGMGKRDFTKVKPVVVPNTATDIDSCRYLLGSNIADSNDMALTMPGGMMSPTPVATSRSGSPEPNETKPSLEATEDNAPESDEKKPPSTLWEELGDTDSLGLDYVDRSSKTRRTEQSIHIRG